ncbi:MAG: hypothetical protein IB618_02905 [Candidatus Pacearchaeota archaeon]|nr:MAG: hypothetical protein IB618_02905 [Candidatus Pacearchaeota archaeon]
MATYTGLYIELYSHLATRIMEEQERLGPENELVKKLKIVDTKKGHFGPFDQLKKEYPNLSERDILIEYLKKLTDENRN